MNNPYTASCSDYSRHRYEIAAPTTKGGTLLHEAASGSPSAWSRIKSLAGAVRPCYFARATPVSGMGMSGHELRDLLGPPRSAMRMSRVCQVESAAMITCNNGKGIHLRVNLST